MTDKQTLPESPLVPGRDRELTRRSAGLVRRGLDDLARLRVNSEQIQDLISGLLGVRSDPQAFCEAAKNLIELGPQLDLKEDDVAELLWTLVVQVRTLFELGKGTFRTMLGEHYPFKPSAELRHLAMRSLEFMVGPIADSHDAVIALFLKGNRKAQIEAATWLGKYEVHKASRLLRDALDESTDEVLTLALRYALAWLGLEDPDQLYREFVRGATSESDTGLKHRCAHYLLEPPQGVSSDTLGRAVYALATHEDENNSQLPAYLLRFTFGKSGDVAPDMSERWRLADCSDDVLAGMMEVAWAEFLRATDMAARYQAVDATDIDTVHQILQDWTVSNPHLWRDTTDKDERVALCRRSMQMLDIMSSRAAERATKSNDRHSPGTSDAQHRLAFSFLQKAQWDDAIREYRAILRLRPDDGMAHFNLAEVLRQQGLLDEAVRAFRKALKHGFADDSAAHYGLARTLRQRGLHEDAIDEFRMALEFEHGQPIVHFRCHLELGTTLWEKRRLHEAMREFKKALTLQPDSADAHFWMGSVLGDQGRPDDALAELEEAVRLRPDFEDAKALLAIGRIKKALRNKKD